ncbi:MAG: radical SAM protein [Bacteroidetes bacterium]|nr:MAG: radical SAM protein [Bacteroidota bacterium]TAG86847.1 MAG: radical SAM protein [Bacteroidota bacterium]
MKLTKKPILCNYYVTYRCNASCSFCDIWEKPSPYITLENAEKNLTDLKKLGVKVIDFTGGEPLLHRQIVELLTLAKQKKFITTLTTNALLYPKYAQKLKGLVDMLHFSLDSPDKDEHDKMRNVKCFDFVMQSIQMAKDLKERPDILFTVFDSNVDKIQRIYEEICLPNNLVLILNPAFDYNEIKTDKILSENLLNTLSKWGKKKNIYLNEAFITLRKDGGNHIEKPICRAGSTTIVISPENKLVLPCYHLGIESLPIDNNLLEIYQSPKVQNLIREEGKYPQCEGCVINCYMQPSFAVEISKYFWKALPSTIKYNYMKGTWKNLLK